MRLCECLCVCFNVCVCVCVSVWVRYYFIQCGIQNVSGLKKECKQQYQIWDYDYKQLWNISEIPFARQEGYLVRFPFYVLAGRDAHIVFTTKPMPDWANDAAYEIRK